uniref:Cytochrome c oxidase subunit 2 n=1 Tax=Fissurella volcano TaxID=707972 RepID=H6V535_FISVO|nr:cytochrome c oxidase subunit II [Fissurella volcano]AFB78087.1 cytochrome c oxidase subunit II [Fissurella volcano]
MAQWGQLSFCDPASPMMEGLINFHNYALMILIMILSFVTYLTVLFSMNGYSDRFTMDGQEVEVVWTIIPGAILIFLVFPSLHLLYLLDEIGDCGLSVKVIGNQWYWSYEYSDFMGVEYDSYMVPSNALVEGEYRLLEVDHRVVVPVGSQVRVLVTSADVIHSWTVPSLGVKADAIPGRLNQLSFFCNMPGVFYGQCSEICGANHSFMPIVLEAVDVMDFCFFIKKMSALV